LCREQVGRPARGKGAGIERFAGEFVWPFDSEYLKMGWAVLGIDLEMDEGLEESG
jgi:hypothetical protein